MADTEKTVRCPYMAEHVMHIDSLLTHLTRCKATNKHLFKNCLYNSLHVVPKQKYTQHIRSCEDRFKKGDNEEDQWEGRNRAAIDYYTHRSNTDFSSSRDDESIFVNTYYEHEHQNQEYQNYQSSFYQDKAQNGMVNYYSSISFQSQPEKNRQTNFRHEAHRERNQYLDFSFRKDHKHLTQQKIGTGTVQSEKETCQSNRSNLELTSEQKSDDDEVLQLIEVIQGKKKNKFIDDTFRISMMKGEKQNKFFQRTINNRTNNVC